MTTRIPKIYWRLNRGEHDSKIIRIRWKRWTYNERDKIKRNIAISGLKIEEEKRKELKETIEKLRRSTNNDKSTIRDET